MFPGFKSPTDLPWTMSFVARKRQQVDSLAELSKDKRPPDSIIWWGTSEELEEWIDKVFDRKEVEQDVQFAIAQEDIG
jgi:hypothetical protein